MYHGHRNAHVVADEMWKLAEESAVVLDMIGSLGKGSDSEILADHQSLHSLMSNVPWETVQAVAVADALAAGVLYSY